MLGILGVACVILIALLGRERRRRIAAESRVVWLQQLMQRATRKGQQAIETILGHPARV